MIIRKKGQGLSMTVIVVAILALVILVILLLVLTGRLALFGGAAQECPGICEDTIDVPFGADGGCPEGYARLGAAKNYLTKAGQQCPMDCCIAVTG